MYPGLLAIGFLFSFLDAYGIGANDVANSFATSVASGSLSYKQAILIALFTEFSGALFLGSGVASTIQKKIVDVKIFQDHPGQLMLGMVCALIGSSTWVLSATRLGLPISTTHSIIGAIMGIGIAAYGTSSIDWGTWKTGFASIVLSWILSPVIAGVIAYVLFGITKFLILDRPNSLSRAYLLLPIYLSGTISVIAFYMVYKGAPGLSLDVADPRIIGGVVAGVCLLALVISYCVLIPHIKRRLEFDELREGEAANLKDHGPQTGFEVLAGAGDDAGDDAGDEEEEVGTNGIKSESLDTEIDKQEDLTLFARFIKFFKDKVEQDVVSHQGDEAVKEMHSRAKKYDPKTEKLYNFLMVLTAAFASFAHGSNDVANAVGPFTTVFYIFQNGSVNTGNTEIPVWILVYCAAALDFGLLTYGYHIMRSLGNKITYHSPARGFTMSLAATLTTLTATKLGLPISTTHCITGATAGVGISDGDGGQVNWKHLLTIFGGWIITVPMAGLTAAIFFYLLSAITGIN